jgi:hypothetical protein
MPATALRDATDRLLAGLPLGDADLIALTTALTADGGHRLLRAVRRVTGAAGTLMHHDDMRAAWNLHHERDAEDNGGPDDTTAWSDDVWTRCRAHRGWSNDDREVEAAYERLDVLAGAVFAEMR